MSNEECDKLRGEVLKKSYELGLPLPRLQLTWADFKEERYNRICFYDLIIPVGKYDCRNEHDTNTINAPMGYTKTSGTREEIHTPYRDGAHIKWDMLTLKFRGFVVDEDQFKEIESNDKV